MKEELSSSERPAAQSYESTPKKRIFFRTVMSASATVILAITMNKLDLKGGFSGFAFMFLTITTIALLILTFRSRQRVILDETGLSFYRGGHSTVVPWQALIDQKALNLEKVMGWNRLNIKTRVADSKVTFALNQIFGVGLPVIDIYNAMQPWILKARQH